jgi:hypothetical protein
MGVPSPGRPPHSGGKRASGTGRFSPGLTPHWSHRLWPNTDLFDAVSSDWSTVNRERPFQMVTTCMGQTPRRTG